MTKRRELSQNLKQRKLAKLTEEVPLINTEAPIEVFHRLALVCSYPNQAQECGLGYLGHFDPSRVILQKLHISSTKTWVLDET